MTLLNQLVTKILQATVYDVAIETPLESAAKLSSRLNNQIYLKREDLQPVFSFKIRGAYNCISQLPAEQLAQGVICASAGNHAQGVALSASRLGIRAVIVMPRTTPPIKIDAVKNYGATVILEGDTFDQANAFARQMASEQQLTFIPPYDDELVIAGQGTIAMELLRQLRDMEYVFVAVGGGGLVAGVAAYLAVIAPHVRVIAVESSESACLQLAMQSGNPELRLEQVGLFADGVAVAQIGRLPYQILNEVKPDGEKVLAEDVITCTPDEICAAIKDIFEENRGIVEPSGALALAGMKKYISQHQLQNRRMIAVVSGANMNFDRLRYVSERTELGEKREAVFAISIPEQTGAFLDFCRQLEGRAISEFNYRYNGTDLAHVFLGIGLKGGMEERQHIMQKLLDAGYTVNDLSDDEMAKLHVRYLIGGKGSLPGERVFRFEFPERPGALLYFLEKLGQQFNISLFHYRNHGAAEGRVLVGIHAAPEHALLLEQRLQGIGYPYQEVTANPAFRLFLQ